MTSDKFFALPAGTRFRWEFEGMVDLGEVRGHDGHHIIIKWDVESEEQRFDSMDFFFNQLSNYSKVIAKAPRKILRNRPTSIG